MKKKILCFFTILFCLVIPFVVAPTTTAQAQTPTSGYSFASDSWYYVDGTLKAPPKTVEAWVYVPEEYSTQTSSIFSNYNGFASMPYFHVALKYDNGALFPYLEWNEVSNKVNSVRKFNFTKTVIQPNTWTHFTIVIDSQNNRCSAYKNGEYIQSNAGTLTLSELSLNLTELPFAVGNDLRYNQPDLRAFKGKIASVSLFSDCRSATEIASDYKNGADYTDENALAHWELSSTATSVVTDLTENEVNLTYNKYWLTEAEMEEIRPDNFDADYSFAVVGDIQYIAEKDSEAGTTYTSTIHKWIKDNIEDKNIAVFFNFISYSSFYLFAKPFSDCFTSFAMTRTDPNVLKRLGLVVKP